MGVRRFGVLLLVPLAAASGVLVAVAPRYGALVVTATALLMMLLALGRRRMVSVFLASLAALLVAYAFLGRGIAYLGVPPVYVGELVLVLAALALLYSMGRRRSTVLDVLLVAFMAWGAYRTVPYLGVYGIDALRDAVVWGYAVFALAVSITIRPGHFERIVAGYRRLVPILIMWVPVAAFVVALFLPVLPSVPGAPVAIIHYKPGDMGVHLAGVAAFLLVGLYSSRRSAPVRELLLLVGWLVAFGLAAALNRGGLLAASAVGAVILFVRSLSRWTSLLLAVVLLLGVVALVDPELQLNQARKVSLGQFIDNVTSILGGEASDPRLEHTKQWRLDWWDRILAYTLDGPYAWTGKGFGIDLAVDDGFKRFGEFGLRAPHNGHLTLLARAGVPGLVLWIALQLVFAVRLIIVANQAWAAHQTFWVQILGWIFVYWLAAIVNTSFDVYLEGPQGGIWFWSLFGLGMAATEYARHAVATARRSVEATAPTAPLPTAARAAKAPV